ncbi:MAG: hypothetical protein GH144_01035 [Clostridia bacterium]|nr:hypothetical protein [Clostridia bacterium]
MAKSKFRGKTSESEARQSANLRQGGGFKPGKAKTPFLKDPRNLDIRYFLEHHYILENRKPLKLEQYEKEILDSLYPLNDKRRFDLACIGLCKKQGKTTFLGGICLWELLFSPSLAPEIYNCSGDKDQARLLFKKSSKAVKRSKEMSKVCKVLSDVITCPARDATYECISADIDSAEGKDPSLVIMDEFGTSSFELFTALQTGRAAREGRGESTLAILIGTAGWDLTSEFYKLYQKGLRKEDPFMFFFWSHEQLASFSSPGFLAKMRKRLQPQVYQRYYENKWSQQSGSFVTREDVKRCLDSSLSPQGKGKPGFRYILACDLGLTKDRSVTSIVHSEEDHIILDSMKVWQGSSSNPVLISDIEDDFQQSYDNFNIRKMVCDPWQMKGTIQKFKEKGYPLEEFIFSSGNLAKLSSNLYYLLHNGLLRFWDDPDLVGELLSIQAIQKSYGMRIDHRAGQFSDRAISLGMACLSCSLKPVRKGRVYVGTGEPMLEVDQDYYNARREPGKGHVYIG